MFRVVHTLSLKYFEDIYNPSKILNLMKIYDLLNLMKIYIWCLELNWLNIWSGTGFSGDIDSKILIWLSLEDIYLMIFRFDVLRDFSWRYLYLNLIKFGHHFLKISLFKPDYSCTWLIIWTWCKTWRYQFNVHNLFAISNVSDYIQS